MYKKSRISRERRGRLEVVFMSQMDGRSIMNTFHTRRSLPLLACRGYVFGAGLMRDKPLWLTRLDEAVMFFYGFDQLFLVAGTVLICPVYFMTICSGKVKGVRRKRNSDLTPF